MGGKLVPILLMGFSMWTYVIGTDVTRSMEAAEWPLDGKNVQGQIQRSHK